MTVNKEEVEKFNSIADQWWEESGPFALLHQLNIPRLSYVKDVIIKTRKDIDPSKPMQNLKVLDVGCGGGIMSEPMSRMGGDVTAIDASIRAIEVAKKHSEERSLPITYLNTTTEEMAEHHANSFDIVTAMEIIEHVDSPDKFVQECSNLLKPNGILFLSTINRNAKSFATAIVAAEYILRLLPTGTHHWTKFIKPSELRNIMLKYGISMHSAAGLGTKLPTMHWELQTKTDINYIISGIKTAPAQQNQIK